MWIIFSKLAETSKETIQWILGKKKKVSSENVFTGIMNQRPNVPHTESSHRGTSKMKIPTELISVRVERVGNFLN